MIHHMFVNKNMQPQAINVVSNTFVSTWLMIVPMKIRIDKHVSPIITSDATILHIFKQQEIPLANKNEKR